MFFWLWALDDKDCCDRPGFFAWVFRLFLAVYLVLIVSVAVLIFGFLGWGVRKIVQPFRRPGRHSELR